MSASIKHTETVWQNWPLRVDVTRGVTLTDDLAEVEERRLIDVAVYSGYGTTNEHRISMSWMTAVALRDALTKALSVTLDLAPKDDA